jgi:putative DNA modification/repair radical SAM protein
MERSKKLAILADAAKYDASCASSGARRERPADGIGNATGMGICHSYAPDGRCISLLKILLTNYCVFDCKFCINRQSSSVPRARFTVEEVVSLTLDFYKRNYIEGLFLSSGIIRSSDYTMEELVRVAKCLRMEHRFGGYIHLKTIPGASAELIAEAGRYADRLSVNIELPTQSDLDRLAPAKSHRVIESAMQVVRHRIDESKEAPSPRGIRPPRFAPAGQTTQLIVGATESTDRDILLKATELYEGQRLRRVYYSAFSPIPDSAPGLPARAAPLLREHRLYQADWLRRFYGFRTEELVSAESPQLPLEHDPKFAWALRNRALFPVDVNRADRALLLRVPGFGVRGVERILKARRFGRLRLADLTRMRIPLSRAKFFVQTADRNPSVHALDHDRSSVEAKPSQLELFSLLSEPSPGLSAASGEL